MIKYFQNFKETAEPQFDENVIESLRESRVSFCKTVEIREDYLGSENKPLLPFKKNYFDELWD